MDPNMPAKANVGLTEPVATWARISMWGITMTPLDTNQGWGPHWARH